MTRKSACGFLKCSLLYRSCCTCCSPDENLSPRREDLCFTAFFSTAGVLLFDVLLIGFEFFPYLPYSVYSSLILKILYMSVSLLFAACRPAINLVIILLNPLPINMQQLAQREQG